MLNIEEISKLPFFFIIGRPRSGTTLLRTMLDAHSEVCIPHESPVILNFYKKYGKKNHWSITNLETFYEDLNSQHIFGVWNINKEKLKNDLLSCEGENTLQNLIKILYLNFNSIYAKREIKVVGDKNPIYSVNFPEVSPIFEKVKFIHLTRDYRDQMVSMKRMDFEMPHPALVGYRWKFSVKSMQPFKDEYPERLLSVKYEDLVTAPELIMKKICGHLNIGFESAMLEFFKKEAGSGFLPEEAMNKYHSSLFNPLSTSKVNAWESKLSNQEVKIADMMVGKSAELAGYKRKFERFGFGLRISVFPVVLYGKIWNVLRKLINALPYRIKMSIKNKSHILPRIYKRIKTSK